MGRKNTENSTENTAIESLMEKVQTIEDWKGRAIHVLPMEGDAATEAMERISGKYPNVDASKGIMQAIHENGKRLVFAMCTENPEEAIGFVRTSDLFQVKFGPTARANRPRSKGKQGGNKALFEALAAKIEG